MLLCPHPLTFDDLFSHVNPVAKQRLPFSHVI